MSLHDKVKAMSTAEKRQLWHKFLQPMIERAGIPVTETASGETYVKLHLDFPDGESDVFKRLKDAMEAE